jgi:hypothetical protein
MQEKKKVGCRTQSEPYIHSSSTQCKHIAIVFLRPMTIGWWKDTRVFLCQARFADDARKKKKRDRLPDSIQTLYSRVIFSTRKHRHRVPTALNFRNKRHVIKQWFDATTPFPPLCLILRERTNDRRLHSFTLFTFCSHSVCLLLCTLRQTHTHTQVLILCC